MDILSVQLGHNATVALFRDGEIKAIISQEKFDYIKNSRAFPQKAIEWIFRKFNVSGESLALVAVAGITLFPMQMSHLAAGHNKRNITSKLWEAIDYNLPGVAEGIRKTVLKGRKNETVEKAKREFLKRMKAFGIDEKKVVFIEHHLSHAYTAYYGFLRGKGEWNILTMDGSGDFYSSTVGIGKDGIYERIAKTPIKASLGYIYSTTTQFLGMKVLEHEYKVMGLAPYVKGNYAEPLYEKHFKPVIWLKEDGLTFDSKFPTSRFGIYLKEKVCGNRFDNIAWAVQRLTEELITKWVRNAVEKTGINNIATSGGVFMNVKANMLLNYEDYDKTFFVPSAGDESNPIGAAYYAYLHYLNGDVKKIKPIKDLYLGMGFEDEEIKEFIKEKDLERKYRVEYYKDIEGVIAELLSKGKVVARFKGRCEFGARALGNRSILADPSKMSSFFKVNDQIKKRDFWMPFAPSMLKERANEYIENPKNRDAPYMIVAFRSTEEGRKYFKAAMHQGDHTLRPQLVEKDWNPSYYKIIKEFEKLTGIGGVLNTSFNLHGYPIACTPEQALHVFENSGLKYLAIENYLISKK